jgi:Mce-associated membrane protein
VITNFYDLLDVAPDATEAEIRAAWKSAIADLDPTDRRFRVYNQAAEVLLDPVQRRELDARLAAEAEARVDAGTGAGAASAGSTSAEAGVVRARKPRTGGPGSTATPPRVPTWALAALAAATAVTVGVCAWLWFAVPSDASVEESTRAAQSAAERAVVPILSYDAQHLDEDQRAAQAYMTSRYRKDYDKVFGVIKENAPDTRTVVKTEVLGSGIVRSGTDRVQVLLFLDRPTTNKQTTEPLVYKDQATVTMERVEGEWLVDDIKSSPVAR